MTHKVQSIYLAVSTNFQLKSKYLKKKMKFNPLKKKEDSRH